MKEYFILQFKLFTRRLRAIGIHPVIGYFLLIGLFITGSILLFDKVAYAGYIFISVSLMFILPLSQTRRNDFLRFHFAKDYFKVRLFENGLMILPCTVILLLNQLIDLSIISLVLALVLVFIKTGVTFNFVLPVPFTKTQFEFTTGCRKTFLIIGFSYLLAIIGILVPNFNIGVFSIIVLILVALSLFTEPENEYYIWIYKRTPHQFLLMKIKNAWINITILVLPVLLMLTPFFPGEIYVLFIFLILGYLAVASVIVAKYSSYPNKMSVPQGILLILSIQLPPLILFVFPYFFSQSVKKLKPLLQ